MVLYLTDELPEMREEGKRMISGLEAWGVNFTVS